MMNPFCTFMASPTGRIIRIIAGVALMAWGALVLGGTLGTIVTLVGAVPLLARLFDFCLFAPLFGCPMGGTEIRAGK